MGVRYLWGYVRANFEAALEYRASFFSQVAGMLLSDIMWLVFWLAYFSRFPLVSGWGRMDIVTLWAVVAAGYGVATAVCGNLLRMAGMILRGELDFFLSLPKPVLPHLLISRMNLTAPGDVIFGFVVYGLVVHPAAGQWMLFLLFVATTAMIMISFGVLTQSLAFWLGSAEGLGQQLANALINFSTYPTGIFHGAARLLLFSVIPAGFVAYLPVVLLRRFSAPLLLGLIGFNLAISLLAWMVFHRGLRRYESGNLLLTRD